MKNYRLTKGVFEETDSSYRYDLIEFDIDSERVLLTHKNMIAVGEWLNDNLQLDDLYIESHMDKPITGRRYLAQTNHRRKVWKTGEPLIKRCGEVVTMGKVEMVASS